MYLEETIDRIVNANDEVFLDVLNEVWSDHKTSVLMVRDILMYMVSCASFRFVSFRSGF
jgi:hypothetical protein